MSEGVFTSGEYKYGSDGSIVIEDCEAFCEWCGINLRPLKDKSNARRFVLLALRPLRFSKGRAYGYKHFFNEDVLVSNMDEREYACLVRSRTFHLDFYPHDLNFISPAKPVLPYYEKLLLNDRSFVREGIHWNLDLIEELPGRFIGGSSPAIKGEAGSLGGAGHQRGRRSGQPCGVVAAVGEE